MFPITRNLSLLHSVSSLFFKPLTGQKIRLPQIDGISHLARSIIHKNKIIINSENPVTELLQEKKIRLISNSENKKIFKTLELPNEISVICETGANRYKIISKAPPIKNIVISGGGAKGVALQGVITAIEEFSSENKSLREQLEHIAGSSVGALTGALLATGVSAKKIIEESNKVDFKKLQGKRSIIPPFSKDGKPLIYFVRQQITTSIKEYLQEFTHLNDDYQTIQTFFREKTGKELKETEVYLFKKLLNEIKKEDPRNVHITFAMLDLLHQLDPKKFKQLTVTATCRETGETFYFNKEKTPNLDISIACRASASLPLILTPVVIQKEDLQPGYGDKFLNGRKSLSFIDGGYLNNIPVDVMENPSINEFQGERAQEGQNLQTLVLVFDEAKRKINEEGKESAQSPYHEAKVDPNMLYNASSRVERFIRDFCVIQFGGVKTNLRNTVTKQQGLAKIQKKYTQRNIPLRLVLENEEKELNTRDFEKAKKHADEYIEIGKKQTEEYLKNHQNEAIARDFTSAEEVIAHLSGEGLSEEMKRSIWDLIL